MSVILTTHYMDEAEQLADDVAIIDSAGRRAGLPGGTVPGRRREHAALHGPPGSGRGSLLKALPVDSSAGEVTPGAYRIVGKVNPQLLATVTSGAPSTG